MPGFDYLRLTLALYLFFWHCVCIVDEGNGKLIWDSALGPLHRSVLPMFFALSGFLIAGSFERNSAINFVTLRALRIAPALALETVLSAVIIGSLFTTKPLHAYFTSPMFWSYFLNITGNIHYYLPGVFDGTPINRQLWTIPYEYQCYASLALLAVVRREIGRYVILLAFTATLFCATMTFIAVTNGPIGVGPAAPRLVITLSFLFGVCIHMFRSRIPLNIYLFAASALLSYVFLYYGDLAFLSPAPIAYMTVSIGCAKLPKLRLWDLSYGIYLFHYSILLSVFHVLGPETHWWDLLAFGLPLTLLFAIGSWTFVEHPVLARKAAVLAFIDRCLAWRPAHTATAAAILPANGRRER